MKFLDRLDTRKWIYLQLLSGERITSEILIIADRPGPAAPTDAHYHHTPFYSDKYCSGWLNSLLEENGIPEQKLAWINAYDRKGIPTSHTLIGLKYKSSKCACAPNLKEIVVLGGNAEKWFTERVGIPYTYFYHPQYWKRFQNKKPYPLIEHLRAKCGQSSLR